MMKVAVVAELMMMLTVVVGIKMVSFAELLMMLNVVGMMCDVQPWLPDIYIVQGACPL